MVSVCKDINCTEKVKRIKNEIPQITKILTDNNIQTILEEKFYPFHVHEFGSTVIFLAFMENLDPDENIIEEYSKEGHVFLLPMRALDLVNLKDGKITILSYKALDHETNSEWYNILIKMNKKFGLKKLFKK